MIHRLSTTSGPLHCAAAVMLVLAAASLALAQQPSPVSPPSPPSLPAPQLTPAPLPASPAATPPSTTEPAPTTQPSAPTPAQAAPAPAGSATAAAGLDPFKATLDAIDKDLDSSTTSEDRLSELKRQIVTLRQQIHARQALLDPRLKEIEQRIAQLGPAPVPPASEDAALAAERARLAVQRGDTIAAVNEAKLLGDRAAEVEQRIDERRRELFTSQLFTRGDSLFDIAFWRDLAQSVPVEIGNLRGLVFLWATYARGNGGLGGAVAAAATLVVLAAAAWIVMRTRRRLTLRPTPRRFDKALVALIILGFSLVTLPALIFAFVLALRNFGLMPYPIVDVGFGLGAAAAATGFGRGVAIGLFAPGEPQRRLFAFSEQEAVSYAAHLTWMARVFGLVVFLNAVHRAAGSPLAPLIATGELLALGVLAITVHLLWRTATTEFIAASGRTAGRGLIWMRAILWLVSAAIAVSLAAGYAGLAVFLSSRVVAVFAIGGALLILMVFIDTLFNEWLAADTPQGRRIATMFGLTPRGLELVDMLLSAAVRLVVLVLAVMVGLSFAGVFVADIFSTFGRATWNYLIGGVSVSPTMVLYSFLLLAAGGIAIRAAQRWLQTQFLPRTGLDAGLQNSIRVLFGYTAFAAVLALALATLGIDLQKIALIAGALSVGIGFGLQSVVSNFVCGIILLAERPIRVGDYVVVQNEEGLVRRISVRATEIETFDRASVIVPNQQLITAMVKNWTYGSTMCRIAVKVRVAYESDVEKVRGILLEVAKGHPQVRANSALVLLMGFGDIGIDFELRCLIDDVAQSLNVRSDLQGEILHRFHDAAIKIPFPGHEARPPGPPSVVASPSHG